MQAADVFEQFKVIGKFEIIKIEGRIDENITPQELLIKIADPLQKNAPEDMVFFFAKRIDFDNGETHINKIFPPYVRKGVSVISDGKNWGLLIDMISRVIGDSFVIEEDELRMIKNVTVK